MSAVIDKIKNIRKTKDPKKVIAKAADLLEKEPERWTKGKWALSSDGMAYDPSEYFGAECDIGGVCKVCLEGALMIYAKDYDTYIKALDIVTDSLGGPVPYAYNDSQSPTTGARNVAKTLREAAAS